jgi:hypothetical protein
MVKYKNELKVVVMVRRVGQSWKVNPGDTVDLPEGVKLDVRAKNGTKCSLTKVEEIRAAPRVPKNTSSTSSKKKKKTWGRNKSDGSS